MAEKLVLQLLQWSRRPSAGEAFGKSQYGHRTKRGHRSRSSVLAHQSSRGGTRTSFVSDMHNGS